MMKSLIQKAVVLFSVTTFTNISLAQSATPKCAQHENQIAEVPAVKAFVQRIGGLQRLEGEWRLSGLAGAFKKVIIGFESTASGLNAMVDGLKETDEESKMGAIQVCETVQTGTLLVKVIKTKDSLYMRAGSGGTLSLAQIEKNKVGTFYTFKKQ